MTLKKVTIAMPICLIFVGIVSGVILINCSIGDVDSDRNNSNCIRYGLMGFSYTIEDIMYECDATKSQVLSQIQGNSVGICPKNSLDIHKTINEIIIDCDVSEISLTPSGRGSSSSARGFANSSSSGGGNEHELVNCDIFGTCLLVTPEICYINGGKIVQTCSSGSSSSAGGAKYCYDSDCGDCDLIGVSYGCLYYDANDCNKWGGTVQTLEWCNKNVGYSNTYGCIYF